jgi:hypothetical protein
LSGIWKRRLACHPQSVKSKPILGVWFLSLSALAGAWLIAGCTSDVPSEVGIGLVNPQVDVVLQPLKLEDIERYTGKNISDASMPLAEQEALYLGSQGGNSSSILLNYDFSNTFSDSFPESRWNRDNITWVRLRFLMLEYYGKLQTPDSKNSKALAKFYDVRELENPFVPAEFPGPVPPLRPDGINLNMNYILDEAEFLEIELPVAELLRWVEAAQEEGAPSQGFVVSEGPGSTPGLSGFSSREMLHPASTLIDYDSKTLVAPIIKVLFAHNDSVFLLEPDADTSTFHEISPTPIDVVTEGMMMRTCLRSYPMLRFDFSSLPRNAFINRAVLAVTNDTLTSFGNLQSIVVSEIDTDLFGVHGDQLPLADLEGAAYRISGMVNLDPTLNEFLEFNVTTAIQRIVNNVYEGERGFILTAGEDFFPAYDLDSVDPDFFFTQFNFFSSSEADTLRWPTLKITYSLVDELEGEGK